MCQTTQVLVEGERATAKTEQNLETLVREGRDGRGSARRSPLLDDDDDGSQEQDEDHQPPGTRPQDQTHVLGMLGNLQGPLGVLAGS